MIKHVKFQKNRSSRSARFETNPQTDTPWNPLRVRHRCGRDTLWKYIRSGFVTGRLNGFKSGSKPVSVMWTTHLTVLKSFRIPRYRFRCEDALSLKVSSHCTGRLLDPLPDQNRYALAVCSHYEIRLGVLFTLQISIHAWILTVCHAPCYSYGSTVGFTLC